MRGQKSKVKCQKSEEEGKSHPQITRISQMKIGRGMREHPPLRTSSDLRDLCGEENPKANGHKRAQRTQRKSL